MSKPKSDSVNRRNFLKTAAASAAPAAVPASTAEAQSRPAAPPAPAAPPVGARVDPAGPPPVTEAEINERPGSDFMVDVLKSLNYEYAFSNPASSFRALHESILNHGNN